MRALALCVLTACRIGFDPLAVISPEQARRAIAIGSNHGCALRGPDIYCWGANDEYQLGDPDRTMRTTPHKIANLPATPIALTAGDSHTCFISADEDVYCWGANENGQSGPRTEFVDSAVILRVNGLPSGALEIAAGSAHTCSLHRDGNVWCWGSGSYGQAGPQRADTQLLPLPVPGLAGTVRIAAGGDSSCALSSAGVVSCWGRNDYGQLGDGTTTSRGEAQSIAGLTATAIGLGDIHACALDGNGAYQCWGSDYSGELGDGTTGFQVQPNPPSPQHGLIGIDGGISYTCSVDDQGVASCWGQTYDGEIGDFFGRAEIALAPVTMHVGGPVAAVSTGDRTACALRRDGEVVCWGYGAQGQIGDGRSDVALPAQVPLTDVRSISAGEHGTCALHGPVATETVSCWGDNRSSVAGETGDLSLVPVPIMAPWSGSVVDLKYGGHHACVRTSGDEIWCWGNDGQGQLGDGTTNSSSIPRRAGTDTFSALAATHSSTCAIRSSDDVVMCWGSNYYGELGTGTPGDRWTPTPVAGAGGLPHQAFAAVAGSYHMCSLDGAGEVWCWGTNARRETGGSDGVSIVNTPTQVALATAATELRGGGGSMCGKDASGSVTCWGHNDNYGLLDPNAEVAALPTSVARTELGYFGETLGCDALGNCWGDGSRGQLGDGTWLPRAASAPVSLPGPPTMMTVGYNHACAIVGGNAYCWGDNPQGQVGNGTTSNAYVPVVLKFP